MREKYCQVTSNRHFLICKINVMMTTQTSNQPAFRGAPFSSTGACTAHPDIQLSNKLKVNGRTVYQEVRKVCPKCHPEDSSCGASTSGSVVKSESRMNSIASNKSARSNFSSNTGGTSRKSERSSRDNGGGSVIKASNRRSSNVSEGSHNHRSSSRSRPRSSSRTRGRDEDERSRARSKSRDRRRAPSVGRNGGRSVVNKKKEYDSPFDSKGRCHYHSQVQLAKKKLMGGWNVSLHHYKELCTL